MAAKKSHYSSFNQMRDKARSATDSLMEEFMDESPAAHAIIELVGITVACLIQGAQELNEIKHELRELASGH